MERALRHDCRFGGYDKAHNASCIMQINPKNGGKKH